MHLDLGKTLFSVVGYLVCWKVIFFFFSAAETSVIIIVTLLLFVLYGFQVVEFPIRSKVTLFGVTIKSQETICSRITLFGVIPISGCRVVSTSTQYLKELNVRGVIDVADKVRSLIPGYGLISIARR